VTTFQYTMLDLAFMVERIAEAEPELPRSLPGANPARTGVPRQLPATVAHFAGPGR